MISNEPRANLKRRFAGPARIGGILSIGILVGWLVSMGCAPSHSRPDYPLIEQAWSTIEHNYVDNSAIKPMPETYGAISGMVDALGDTGHSTFLTPDMVKQLKNMEHGELKGIGVEIKMKDGHVVIVAPIDDSPAQSVGLRAGDIILKVDGKDISGVPINEVVDRISGSAGTKVQLTVLDPKSGHTREVTVTRASIKLHEVTWATVPGTQIAHLRISSFNGGVANDFMKALREIQDKNVTGIILDLRNNPGGILDEAVRIASQFLDGGTVLKVKDAKGQISSVSAHKGGLATKIPLVVLINYGSASASEIVAGALRDNDRAELVGETTFGTGTVLGEFKLSDGSALLLAIEEWLTPDGESFWHKGITPGIKVSMPDEAEPLRPEVERNMTPQQFQASNDQQLLRALQVLQSQALTEQTRVGTGPAIRRR